MIQVDLQGNIYDCQIEQNHSVIATKFYSLEKQIELKDKEIERLRTLLNAKDNIINELEKWLKDNLGNCRTNTNYTSNQIYNLKEDTYHKCLNKLQELKGDSSNE